jgi:Serine phosphatase RsbU, regulator of sigma subunit
VRTVLEECTSVLTEDALRDPRFRAQDSIVLQSVHSAMAVPLFDNRAVLGLLYVDSQDLGLAFTPAQLEVLTLLANMAAVKISNARLLAAEQARQRQAHELATATQIQRGMLVPAPRVAGWQVEVCLEPCHEVGGDLYDCRVTGERRLVFQVGDVTGKGHGRRPAHVVVPGLLARALRELRRSGHAGLAPRRHRLRVRRPRALHHRFRGLPRPRHRGPALRERRAPAALLLDGGAPRPLESNGVPFGVLPGFDYATATATIPPGGLLAVFSDGIPEAQRGEEMFEDERLREALLAAAAEPDLADVRRGLLGRLDAFLGDAPRSDDVTLLLIRRGDG